ncbi:hypothetical protein MGG_15658 [Pyricularia oryzae 70-15]|uniref:Uncharacterized protein n=1 Tax=Pyricularia oryzae (strain 70-15 / ATCC MYA-4617 / FGSC 8958) TaxID=242507 RepID=G4MY53_PYRO7|nr:uncharacterized protein MGG_15658 [Pyricularia oryzae 70-15]EHA54384.1 hypothetical protein MGG_15658 [Pyricularia oryzae 70-15]
MEDGDQVNMSMFFWGTGYQETNPSPAMPYSPFPGRVHDNLKSWLDPQMLKSREALGSEATKHNPKDIYR